MATAAGVRIAGPIFLVCAGRRCALVCYIESIRSISFNSAYTGLALVFFSGFFGKIDDVSFWLFIAGILAARSVTRAWLKLPLLPTGISVPITIGDIRVLLTYVTLMSSIYVVVMYFTNGTFFSSLLSVSRAAQVLEGLSNLALIAIFAVYFVVARLTQRRAHELIQAGSLSFSVSQRHDCAKLLANAPCMIVLAFIGSVLFFPTIKWVGVQIYSLTGYGWLNWMAFKPEPWAEVLLGAAGALVIGLILFLPWASLLPSSKKLLVGGCRFVPNLFLLVILVAGQAAIPTLIVLMFKDLFIDKKGDLRGVLNIKCATSPSNN